MARNHGLKAKAVKRQVDAAIHDSLLLAPVSKLSDSRVRRLAVDTIWVSTSSRGGRWRQRCDEVNDGWDW